MEKNHFIISNVTRCIKSFKFFLLGVLSNRTNVKILSDFWEDEEQVESAENQKILKHLNAILRHFEEKKRKEVKKGGPSVVVHCGEEQIAEHCRSIGLDVDSFSIEVPKKKENNIFHPIKKFK